VSGGIPVWERLRAPDRRPLDVGPLERRDVDRLVVDDGNLPAHAGATVFDAWREGSGVAVRAAHLDGSRVMPLVIHAAQLEIRGSDGRLEALLGDARPVAAPGELERLACACRGVTADAVYRAIGNGWETIDQLKRATRIAFGECQGRRCVPWLAARLELDPTDPRARLKPRPPLVPVPLAILAAYAEGASGDGGSVEGASASREDASAGD
jgi:bacterioferritin-associated ferredoxin